jgi:hypothetical protein
MIYAINDLLSELSFMGRVNTRTCEITIRKERIYMDDLITLK